MEKTKNCVWSQTHRKTGRQEESNTEKQISAKRADIEKSSKI